MGKTSGPSGAGVVDCATALGSHRPSLPRLRRALADRRGAAALEFALAMPFVTVLLIGAFDYGNLAYTMMEVRQAAHSGAFYAYNAVVTSGACSTSGMKTAEQSATSLGAAISTSPPAGSTGLLAATLPSCSFSGCPNTSSPAGIVASGGSNCTAGAGDAPGTYAVAYASTSFSPILPWAALAFPSTLSAVAVIRYK
jgi:Flp pilus assembly pilin Flp